MFPHLKLLSDFVGLERMRSFAEEVEETSSKQVMVCFRQGNIWCGYPQPGGASLGFVNQFDRHRLERRGSAVFRGDRNTIAASLKGNEGINPRVQIGAATEIIAGT